MSSEKKVKVMSLSLEPEMHELIKESAKRLGHKNVSQLIRDLVSKYLDLLVNDGDETAVIIRIPDSVSSDSERLRGWLRSKADAIAAALSDGTG